MNDREKLRWLTQRHSARVRMRELKPKIDRLREQLLPLERDFTEAYKKFTQADEMLAFASEKKVKASNPAVIGVLVDSLGRDQAAKLLKLIERV